MCLTDVPLHPYHEKLTPVFCQAATLCNSLLPPSAHHPIRTQLYLTMSRLKSQLLARTKSHQTPRLSFVLNLPAEVLATVFHEVFATFSLHEDGFKDALNLGLVSKEWRAVLLSHFVASLHCRVSLTSLKDVTAFANLVKGTVGHWLTNDLSIWCAI